MSSTSSVGLKSLSPERWVLSADDLAAANSLVAARPSHAKGVSPLAVQAARQWDAGDRPKGWQGRVYGLVVHTSGGGLPADARELGVYHTVRAAAYYSESHGCHYVNGWRGAAGGDLLQIANEREQANGVGVTNKQEPAKDQRRSIERGCFEAALPPVLVGLWRARWPGVADSLALLPRGVRTVNSCFIHVECVPCVFHFRDRLVTGPDAEPLRPGLRFTQAQHETVAQLAVDIAGRNGWPTDEEWWRTPRLVGHEDLTPISRHDSRGGWDPGYLRKQPYFDFDYVYELIEVGRSARASTAEAGDTIFDALGELGKRIKATIASGQELLAVSLARSNGIEDENELTNMVFFARHPELHGRPLERHETALRAEWLAIRDEIVRPQLNQRVTPSEAPTR